MRYTRYDMRTKKRGKGFIFIILLVLVFAFLIGSIMWRLLIKNGTGTSGTGGKTNTVKNSKIPVKDDKGSATIDGKVVSFTVIQGGLYSDKNNAQNQKTQLMQYGTPFTVEDQGKVRVFIGVYGEEKGKSVIKSLADQKVDSSKLNFSITKGDVCDSEIVEILNANIEILNKLSEKDVKAIQTDELKKWCTSLKEVNEGKNIAVLKELKSHVNKLPKEITKDKAEENYVYIYGMLKKVGEKK